MKKDLFLEEARLGPRNPVLVEYDEVRWVTVLDARRMLSFDTYRELLDRALAEPA